MKQSQRIVRAFVYRRATEGEDARPWVAVWDERIEDPTGRRETTVYTYFENRSDARHQVWAWKRRDREGLTI